MGKGRRRHRDAPHVQPVDVDGVRTVSILTIIWAVAFVVLAFNRERLEQTGNGWLLWTCLAGVGLGLLGIEYTRKRREAIAQAQLDEEAALEESDDDARSEAEGREQAGNAAPDTPAQQTATASRRSRAAEPLADPQDRTKTRPIPYGTDAPAAGERPEANHPRDAALPVPDAPSSETQPWPRRSLGPSPLPPVNPLPTARPETSYPSLTPPVGPGTPYLSSGPSVMPEPPRPQRRHRKPSPGAARPGRVDVGDVTGDLPLEPEHGHAAGPSPGTVSPRWSELLDTPTTSRPSVTPAEPDEPLLDDTTFGGRRAKRYDSDEEISDITNGGGTAYRGRRARRRPDSA